MLKLSNYALKQDDLTTLKNLMEKINDKDMTVSTKLRQIYMIVQEHYGVPTLGM